eukprot:scaffold189210_cov34-Prasinocladus_malaysianus.AAC.1
MFCCFRPNAKANDEESRREQRDQSKHSSKDAASVDFGTLTELYEPITLLGSGAYGDTYLM